MMEIEVCFWLFFLIALANYVDNNSYSLYLDTNHQTIVLSITLNR